jgi:hypothetical protein
VLGKVTAGVVKKTTHLTHHTGLFFSLFSLFEVVDKDQAIEGTDGEPLHR